MITTLVKLFWVSRPISWPNTAFPFAAAYLVAGGHIDLIWLVATVYFTWPYNLFMYGINDVFDYESDIRNPRKGGIEGMKEERAFHPTIVKAVLISNLPFVVFLLMQGGLAAKAIFLFVLFMVLAYSVARLRFKEIPILDSMTSSSHFVGPMVYGLMLTSLAPQSWPYVIAFFLWGMASHAFGAVQDILPDRKGGLASIATFIGARLTVRLTAIVYALASLLITMQGGFAVAVGLSGLLYVANVARYWNITDSTSPETNDGWKRFIWLNFFTGFVVTIVLLCQFVIGKL